jgi:hypothetical protein
VRLLFDLLFVLRSFEARPSQDAGRRYHRRRRHRLPVRPLVRGAADVCGSAAHRTGRGARLAGRGSAAAAASLCARGASLILGAIWGFWHLPAFLLSGTEQSAWSFGPFAIGVLALSVLVTPMFNAARGSLLIPALFHFQMNGPAWPDAQPWENYIFAIAAVAIVLLNRNAMLTRDQAVTEVLYPGEEPTPDDTHSPARAAS